MRLPCHSLLLLLLLLFSLFHASQQQQVTEEDLRKLEAEVNGEYEPEEEYEKEILVIPNKFPKELNFFCEPKNDLMRDRICFGKLDAYAVLCADENPPIHMVPFCLVFKNTCSKISYPSEEFCDIERQRYKGFCTRNKRKSCKSCYYDVTCSCEPYECIWRRYGFETAKWCQQYELYCDKNKRRQKTEDLLPLLKESVRIHYRCLHMFNLVKVVCDPMRRQFDWERCMKFLFDCELITDFSEDDKQTSESIASAEKSDEDTEGQETEEDIEEAHKLAVEEDLLKQLVNEKEGAPELSVSDETILKQFSNTTTTTMAPVNILKKEGEHVLEIIKTDKEKEKEEQKKKEEEIIRQLQAQHEKEGSGSRPKKSSLRPHPFERIHLPAHNKH